MGLTSYLSDLNKDFRSGLNSAIGASTGTSAADQLDMLVKMNQPTKYGWSWNQLANQLQYEQYVKELSASLQKSSAANLNYNIALNKALPSSMRAGLESAGYNPILGVLGSYNAQTGSVSSSVGSQGLGTLPQVSRGGSSAFSAAAVNKAIDMFVGKLGAEVQNVKTDTENKQISNEDIKASANLKNAEADNIRARTATEDSIRSSKVKEADLKASFGDGLLGSVGRTATHFSKEVPKAVSEAFSGVDSSLLKKAVKSQLPLSVKMAYAVGKSLGAVNNSSSAKSVGDSINPHTNSSRSEESRLERLSRGYHRVAPLIRQVFDYYKPSILHGVKRAVEKFGSRRYYIP